MTANKEQPPRFGIRCADLVNGFYSFLGYTRLTSKEVVQKAVARGVQQGVFGYCAGTAPVLDAAGKYQAARSKVRFDVSIADDEVDLALRDPDSSLNLAMAATHAGGTFVAAVNAIAPLLVGAEHNSLLVERLLELNIAPREPGAVLQLIGLAVDTNWQWPDPKLRDLLNQIQLADDAFAAQPNFRNLDEYLRRHNM
jgi:hypothetical protein